MPLELHRWDARWKSVWVSEKYKMTVLNNNKQRSPLQAKSNMTASFEKLAS